MKIAAATDYIGSTGCPERPLRLLAEAGFTHLHWCHQWCTDFLYSQHEINAYKKMLKNFGLTLLDIHGSQGQEKCWYSELEYQRKAGVELVINRIEMMTELEAEEGGALMMHFPVFHAWDKDNAAVMAATRKQLDIFKRTLDDLLPVLDMHGRKIALENMWGDNWDAMDEILAEYPAQYIGICYDSGHANSKSVGGKPFDMGYCQMDRLEKQKDRLEALHLHDNNGDGDQHQPPFYGNVDWERLAKIIATSKSYTRPVSFEMTISNTPFLDKERQEKGEAQTDEAVLAFLKDAHERCEKFGKMVEAVEAK